MAELAPETVTGEKIKEKHEEQFKYPEVLFPGEFTPEHPWDEPEFSGHGATIPIYRLIHVTHEKEARSIEASNFTFAPQLKLGKAYEWDGSPRGETYKKVAHDRFMEIPRSFNNPVFPGYLSWWGVDVQFWYETTDEGAALLGEIKDNEPMCFAADYLAPNTASPYGNKAFSMGLGDILREYKRSRSDKPDKRVGLKVGGTLRYRYEICYVVIVCMEDDYVEMPPLQANTGPFHSDQFVDVNGIVTNPDQTPTIQLQSVMKKVGTKNYSWEQLVFGFHYPALLLQCQEAMIGRRNVDHAAGRNVEHGKCTSTQPPVSRGRGASWVCPNENKPN